MPLNFNFENECRKIVAEYPAVKQFEYLRTKGENIILLKYDEYSQEYESNVLMNSIVNGKDNGVEYRLKKLARDHGTFVKIKLL